MSEEHSIKQEYKQFILVVKKDGGILLKFQCPYCQEEIETLVAPGKAVRDSLTTCPYCQGTFMKIATATRVATAIPGGEI